MKDSFLLHKDSLCILPKMTDEMAGRFIKAIHQYQVKGELPELDFALEMAVTPFINQFIRDEAKYNEVKIKRIEAGAKGGQQRVANQANASKPEQPQANQAVSVSVSVSDSVSDSVNENVSESKNENKKSIAKKVFAPPSIIEVEQLFAEKGFNAGYARKAYDHYALHGWKDSNGNQVKNWKQKFGTNWLGEDKKNNGNSIASETPKMTMREPKRNECFSEHEYNELYALYQKKLQRQ